MLNMEFSTPEYLISKLNPIAGIGANPYSSEKATRNIKLVFEGDVDSAIDDSGCGDKSEPDSPQSRSKADHYNVGQCKYLVVS